MKITFSARHFEASEQLQLFAQKELGRLARFFKKQEIQNTMIAEIILEENGNLKIVEIRINIFGKVLPSRAEGNDFYEIIPQAVKRIEKQLMSTKAKVYNS